MIYCLTLSVPLFHHLCSTVPPSNILLYHHQMFHCSIVRWSTVRPSEVLLFHHDCSTVPSSDVPPFQHQMFSLSISRCSTVSPLDVSPFHHQMFYCPTIRGFNVPPSMFQCFTTSVTLFQHQMFYCSTIRCSPVPIPDDLLFHIV